MNKQLLLYILLCLSIPSTNAQLNIDTTSYNTVIEQVNFDVPNFVVIGEHHYINYTFAAEYFIIEKLAAEGCKNIYIEGGHSEAAIMNIYLQTGDTTVLKYTRAREQTGQYRRFLESIYNLNKKNNYGLIFSGFDFERPFNVGYLFSKWFNTTNTMNLKSIGNYFNSLDDKTAISLTEVEERGFKMKAVLDSIKKTFDENYYKDILKENYNLFYKIIYNPSYANFKKGGIFSNRDPYFIQSMMQAAKDSSLNKSIIILGNSHVIDEGRFIAALADSLIEKYSITCFLFVYNNCKNFDDNKQYTSPKSHLKYLSKNIYKNPQINFTLVRPRFIPTRNDEVISIAVGMYNY